MNLARGVPELLRQQCLIGGQWVDARSQERLTVHDPATGTAVGSVPLAGAEEARYAIETAQSAFEAWRTVLPAERAAIMERWLALVLANLEDLARLITLEQGKPLAEARGEVKYAASFIEWYAEEAKRIYGSVIPPLDPDRRNLVTKEPIGVVGAITPWNFPSVLVARKVAPAVSAGCAVVLKPAPQTPFSALALAELGLRAGLPPGLFNVVTGNAEAIGRELTTNPLVRKISFTGSAAIGRKLLRDSAETIKKVSLELGGNAPFIVFDDADLDRAVEQAIQSKFRNNGQTCSCTNRFLVQAGIHGRFVAAFVEATRKLRVGPGLSEGVDLGPLVSAAALQKVQDLVQDARLNGARVLTGGESHALGRFFFEPTVITGVTPEMRVAREEIFGPVAPVMRFETEEDAIRIANDTEYGLTAYLFTGHPGRLIRVSEKLAAGIVGANTAMISSARLPFGGVKQSGIGREGASEGLNEYLETKLTCIDCAL